MPISDYLPQPVLDLAGWCGLAGEPEIGRQALPDWYIRHHRDAELLCERAWEKRDPRAPSDMIKGRATTLMGPPGSERDRAQLALLFKAGRVGLVVDMVPGQDNGRLPRNDLGVDGEFRRDGEVKVTVDSWVVPQQRGLPDGLDMSRLCLKLQSRTPGTTEASSTTLEMDLLQVTALPGQGAWSPQVALAVVRHCAAFRDAASAQAPGDRSDTLAVLTRDGAPQPQMLADAERLHARWRAGDRPPLTEVSVQDAIVGILQEYPQGEAPRPIATERAIALLGLAEELLKLPPPPRRYQAP
ncbi:hypothetical protein [Mitsuaria sp. 7]|uniref:hypothetical protein n=1 Tax=Mitsuaria sp. 7 TaxID=1658665 RepID=UPI0007DE104E|nr:hypothetical protein [Mitsuaria sp. 7]ANH69467.1 hypothetical protein ABE85_21205 [Mitsuaria sp. 7]